MKKILLVILVLALGIGFGLALRPSQPSVEEELYCLRGINGIEECYTVEQLAKADNVVNASDEFDKTKNPSYMSDVDGNYVSMEDIQSKFKLKYFNSLDHIYDWSFYRGGVTEIRLFLEDDLDANEVYAKIVLMFLEFQNYEFYFISSSDVVFEVHWMDSVQDQHKVRITVGSHSLLSVGLVITPQAIWDGDFEMLCETYNANLSIELIQAIFDGYVLDESFIDYVLTME